MSIKSVSDFINQLKGIPKTTKNYEIFYRGHSDTTFTILPSIYRKKFIHHEEKFFKEIIIRSPIDFANESSALEKLVKMQHYGIPTRILDITTNPLVALYFASNEFQKRKDGEVLMFGIPKTEIKFYDSDTVSIITNIAKRPITFSIEHIGGFSIDKFNKESEVQFLLHEIREEKPHFLPIIDPRDLKKVIAVKVKMNNNRIIRQSGAFLVFGVEGSKENCAPIPDNWVIVPHTNATSNIPPSFVVDMNSKAKIIEELDVLGISESTLFPELENQAKYLKDLYQ